MSCSSIAERTWLRENCACGECFDAVRSQRRVSFYRLNDDSLTIKEVSETLDANSRKQINITWSDGHQSHFDADWMQLQRNQKSNFTTPKILWNAEKIQGYLAEEAVTYEQVHSDKNMSVIKKVCENLHKYGFVVIKNVPTTQKHMEETVEKISEIRPTIYGKSTLIGIDPDDELLSGYPLNGALKDTAYDDDDLQVHVDGTYFTETPAFVVLFCLKAAKVGGEAVLVDSFHVASQLKTSSPKLFHSLANDIVTFNYIDDQRTYIAKAPTIAVDPVSKEFQCVRYNHLDRGPQKIFITNSTEDPAVATNVINGKHVPGQDNFDDTEEARFYEALSEFSKLTEKEENELILKLKEGELIIVDNWRLLHGRKAYVPPRIQLTSKFAYQWSHDPREGPLKLWFFGTMNLRHLTEQRYLRKRYRIEQRKCQSFVKAMLLKTFSKSLIGSTTAYYTI
ncbi:hypothetical protein HELRODRAFT_161402 [Helobdella robusta]|uniref:trimethyllysine dioxygenase n=1 Tax=Helobdella robusta TaxID=6412 RepID=T1ERG0_HELRO|nr:hypothetical protein HELRODRAFT_161402 [Helobdella robusta]ESO02165.1 hypothetical protein HELRODRAFT_161402 [Helobdella robusta]